MDREALVREHKLRELIAELDQAADRLIRCAGTLEPAKVRDALAATRNFPHLAGELISFNPLREINMPMNVNVVKDGKFRHNAWIDDLKLLAPPTE